MGEVYRARDTKLDTGVAPDGVPQNRSSETQRMELFCHRYVCTLPRDGAHSSVKGVFLAQIRRLSALALLTDVGTEATGSPLPAHAGGCIGNPRHELYIWKHAIRCHADDALTSVIGDPWPSRCLGARYARDQWCAPDTFVEDCHVAT